MPSLPQAPAVDLVLGAILQAGGGGGSPWGPVPFHDLALESFRYQYRHNPVYARFCDSRGRTPDSVGAWHEIPAVPTRAFKDLPLVVGDPENAQAVFRTSGTTAGETRGIHRVQDLRLYDAAALSNFRRHLVPEGEPIPFLSLIPGRDRVPDSSLAHMVHRAHRSLGHGPLEVFMDPDRGLDSPGFARGLEKASQAGAPVLVLGTAFAFVHWVDSPESRSMATPLPPGSRVMETGGFKGRSREVARSDLYSAISGSLGVPEGRIVNEYGMTEMCSQFYEPVLLEKGQTDLPGRRHAGPPWVRTRVLDPVTLDPVPEGRIGVLSHFDLANLGSVCHLLTEDLGMQVKDGFRVLGRSPGAEPRGCSLTMEELLESQRGGDGRA